MQVFTLAIRSKLLRAKKKIEKIKAMNIKLNVCRANKSHHINTFTYLHFGVDHWTFDAFNTFRVSAEPDSATVAKRITASSINKRSPPVQDVRVTIYCRASNTSYNSR